MREWFGGKMPAQLRITAGTNGFAATLLATAVIGVAPALADTDSWQPADWQVSAPQMALGHATLKLDGEADGILFDRSQTQADSTGVTGQIRLNPSLRRVYDSGLMLALEGEFLVLRDRLANDRYGNDVFEKLSAAIQTGLGRLEIGQTDGVAWRLAAANPKISGPKPGGPLALDDPEISLFADPATGRAFAAGFTPRSAPGASANFAKIAYYTPRLFGLQLGVSFTPSEGKNLLPFLSAGPQTANRQNRIWEMAANYQDYFGPVTATASAGVIMAHNENRTPGHEGLTDWGLGLNFSWPIDDAWTVSAGGAWRRSNAYAFAINSVQDSGNTTARSANATVQWYNWSLGFSYTDGTAKGTSSLPHLDTRARMVSAGYRINRNLDIAAGWQRMDHTRSSGTFYNGAQTIAMDAGFLQLQFHL